MPNLFRSPSPSSWSKNRDKDRSGGGGSNSNSNTSSSSSSSSKSSSKKKNRISFQIREKKDIHDQSHGHHKQHQNQNQHQHQHQNQQQHQSQHYQQSQYRQKSQQQENDWAFDPFSTSSTSMSTSMSMMEYSPTSIAETLPPSRGKETITTSFGFGSNRGGASRMVGRRSKGSVSGNSNGNGSGSIGRSRSTSSSSSSDKSDTHRSKSKSSKSSSDKSNSISTSNRMAASAPPPQSSSSTSSSPNHTNPSSSRRIIPGISQMTMRQTLVVIFSAFWERADLYTDVLALEHDNPSPRQLRLAFFRQGRMVLATPIESPDDMTTISAGMKPVFSTSGGAYGGIHGDVGNDRNNNNNNNNDNDTNKTNGANCVIQPGVKVSRKAKIKFQAINLAYDLLKDDAKRKSYDEWRLWHCRLPPPPGFYALEVKELQQEKGQQQQQQHQQQQQQHQQQQQQQQRQYPQQEEIKVQYTFQMDEKESRFSNSNSNSNTYMSDSNDSESGMESSISSSGRSSTSGSLKSILREPKFGKIKKKKKKKKYLSSRGKRDKSVESDDVSKSASSVGNSTSNSTCDRRIRWNEEVEELVIMECSREYSNADISQSDLPGGMHPYDPFTSFESTKENVDPSPTGLSSSSSSSPDDPYGDPSVMKNGWFETRNNKNIQNKSHSGVPRFPSNKNANTKSNVPALSGPAVSYNFHSLDDSTLTIVQPSDNHADRNGKLDDSLIAILDAPSVSSHSKRPTTSTTSRHWADKVGEEMQQRKLATIHKEWNNNNTHSNNRGDANNRNEENLAGQKKKVLVDEGTSYVKGEGGNNLVRIHSMTFQKERDMPSKAPPAMSMANDNTNINTNNFNGEAPDIFHQYQNASDEFELNVDELSLDTRETGESRTNWREFDNKQFDSFNGGIDCAYQPNDCGTFSRPDCMRVPANDCGSIDFAKGFQASLSNYINAAVADVKEGWNNLGKKWEENVPKLSEKGENPFLLNPFELDAMMDILKIEMSNIPHRMTTSTSPSPSPVAQNTNSDPSPFRGDLPRCQPRFPRS